MAKFSSNWKKGPYFIEVGKCDILAFCFDAVPLTNYSPANTGWLHISFYLGREIMSRVLCYWFIFLKSQ